MNNACDQCDCKAIQKQQVKIHKQSKHDDMKYTCDQCDDKTTYMNSLNFHTQYIYRVVFLTVPPKFQC